MCQPNTRPPTEFVTLGVNYFSCVSTRTGGVVRIRAWARRGGCWDLTKGKAVDCDYCLNSWVDSGYELGHQHDPQRTSKIFYARGSIWSDRQPRAELFTSTWFSLITPEQGCRR